MKFGIQPADVYMNNYDMAMMPKKFKMKGVNFSELIATHIKAPDVEIFLSALFKSCLKCTGVKINPIIIHSDCAGQLKTGIIAATRGDRQVSTQIKFTNVLCVKFLRMDDMMEKKIAETDNWIETEKWGQEVGLRLSNTLIHESGSHIWRAFDA